MAPVTLRTPRLVLRPWTEADRAPFAAMGADPDVMRHFPGTLDRAESDAIADRIAGAIEERGWGFWALAPSEEPDHFLGFTGLSIPGFEAPFTPCVEIGWRLARPAWGKGLASEAARAALAYGFGTLGLDSIVAFTAVGNAPSRAVMVRIGMTHEPEGDFDHPVLPLDHPLCRHVLYRIRRTD